MWLFLRGEQLEFLYEKPWIQAGGDKESIPTIWDPIPREVSSKGGGTAVSEREVPVLKIHYPTPCNWRKNEFHRWKHLVAQGHGIQNFENDKINNGWLKYYRGIPHSQLITALQLRANVYLMREFLARGRCGDCARTWRHRGADFDTTAHIIGNCSTTKDARIKRHNSICETLNKEAKREGWTVFQETHRRDGAKELHKPYLIFVKESKA